MTVIAYRDGVMAADTLATQGGQRIGYCTKIVRNGRGDLAGAAGNSTYADAFSSWFAKGEKGKGPEADAGSDYCDRGLIVRANGAIEFYEKDGRFSIIAPYVAMGSGRSEALAAMFNGASAEQAVKTAIALDVGCGGDITVLSAKASKRK